MQMNSTNGIKSHILSDKGLNTPTIGTNDRKMRYLNMYTNIKMDNFLTKCQLINKLYNQFFKIIVS